MLDTCSTYYKYIIKSKIQQFNLKMDLIELDIFFDNICSRKLDMKVGPSAKNDRVTNELS